jgi:hypothetical protein
VSRCKHVLDCERYMRVLELLDDIERAEQQIAAARKHIQQLIEGTDRRSAPPPLVSLRERFGGQMPI